MRDAADQSLWWIVEWERRVRMEGRTGMPPSLDLGVCVLREGPESEIRLELARREQRLEEATLEDHHLDRNRLASCEACEVDSNTHLLNRMRWGQAEL